VSLEQESAKTGIKQKSLGDDLLSQGRVPQVPSALAVLASGFGMGPGVSPPHKSPRDFCTGRILWF
jgi:hypothetical protein